MSEDYTAERPRDVTDGICRERQNDSCQRVKRWKKKTVEDQRGERVINCEIIPLERGAYRTGRRKPAGARSCAGVCHQQLAIHRFRTMGRQSLPRKLKWRRFYCSGGPCPPMI